MLRFDGFWWILHMRPFIYLSRPLPHPRQFVYAALGFYLSAKFTAFTHREYLIKKFRRLQESKRQKVEQQLMQVSQKQKYLNEKNEEVNIFEECNGEFLILLKSKDVNRIREIQEEISKRLLNYDYEMILVVEKRQILQKLDINLKCLVSQNNISLGEEHIYLFHKNSKKILCNINSKTEKNLIKNLKLKMNKIIDQKYKDIVKF